MKKSFRKFGLICSLFAFATGLVFGVKNLQPVSANSAPDFESVGASVRTVDPTGLRFIFSVDKQYKDAGYSYGTLIIPKVILGENTLNHNDDTADEIDLNYTPVFQEKWATEAYKEIKAEDETHFYEDGREYFNAVLTKIPEAYYGTTLVARAYAVKDGVYYYSAPVERSMAQVAAYALQNGEEGELLTKYVDTALANQTLTMNVTTAYMATDSEQSFDVLNDNDYSAIWTSSNTDVATVDNNGKVTAKATGKATISATLGSQTFSASVQVGNAIDGDKQVDFTAENYTSKATPGNAVSAYSSMHTYNGEGMIELTSSMNWALNVTVKSVDISQCAELKVMVYQETGYGRIFRAYINGAYLEHINIQTGSWAEYTIDVSQITTSILDVKFYFSKNTENHGEKGEKVYISDIYAAGERKTSDIPVGGELLVRMSAMVGKTFVNDGSNASVSYSEDYTKFGSGMAKITATNNWQSAGVYTASLDVSAYSKITFSVYRPAGEGGYYLRVKSKNGSSYPQIYAGTSIAKVAGEWVEVTINVSDLTNKNLQNMYVQFGTTDSTTGAAAEGSQGKYILVSDIYGIK
ncbi:MAG: hypothetical protein E7343_04335 [Clostridiales bacterium]|nr:hypothetical protein [Clostridiales bacterium]